jgi:Zn-dependent protease
MFDTISSSQGTRRFLAYLVAIVVLAALGVLAMMIRAEVALVDAVLWPVAFLAGGYLGFGMLHDGVVRRSLVGALASLAPKAARAVSTDPLAEPEIPAPTPGRPVP